MNTPIGPISYVVRRCDTLNVIGPPLLGSMALAWRWSVITGKDNTILQNPGTGGVSALIPSTYDAAAEMELPGSGRSHSPAGVCVDLLLLTLPGNWRLAAYVLDYDLRSRIETLSLHPYQGGSGDEPR